MPRLADHDARRRQITDAARRVIVRGGLDAATFQAVAAEAGISVRLVQYYFGTKRDFLLGTLKSVIDAMALRFLGQFESLGTEPDPRFALQMIGRALLPLDDIRRDEAQILAAYQAARLTGSPTLPGETLAPARLLEQTLAEHIRRARGLAPGSDSPEGSAAADRDAELLTVVIAGLSQAVLSDFYSPERAAELLDHTIDRVLDSERPRPRED
ncbi:TetR/AcrR family transcriptional regulator [Nocardia higoensis]|uniref:TetR/AcrR family transcriptional regulator n=1 Tax=Nocardia higoensis TaxID=228599 RepID=UPI0002FD3B90|nr:TetR/AcrR family transcriptional regulator [Nocardia higoensis]